MDHNLKLADWSGRRVRVVIDRPLGSGHPDDPSLVYMLNYGFVPGTTAPGGEPLDVYIIDAEAPLGECEAEVIAIVRRRDDVEDKLVARVGHRSWSASEIAARTEFQERWFSTFVEVSAGPEPFEHGYTNRTVRDGMTVIKDYVGPDSSERGDREERILRTLHGRIPVPEVIESGPNRLRTRLVSGTHGKDLMTADRGAAVLKACGETLRRIHGIDISMVLPDAPAGSTLIHGDYGPNNLLLDERSIEVLAVLDWEWAHPGEPVEDVAWCEWIVRTFHPELIGAMAEFYAAYGERPIWSNRKAAMLAKLHQLHLHAERRDPGGAVASTRLRQLAIADAWTDCGEEEPH